MQKRNHSREFKLEVVRQVATGQRPPSHQCPEVDFPPCPAKWVHSKSITENIDTTTSGGKLVFHIFGALAEFERDIIRERTNAGLQAARARGRLGGRPKTLNTPKKVAMAQLLYDNKNNTIDEICKTLNISRATLYRYIQTKQKDA